MSVELSSIAVQVLNGLVYGMFLFMIAAGLSIIFGLMNVINMAHGVVFVLGAYVASSLVSRHIGFWGALVIAPLAMALLGVVLERSFVVRTYGKERELDQVLITFGLALILTDAIRWIWGTSPRALPTPSLLDFSVSLGAVRFPAYRLFVLLIGGLLAGAFWFLESRTRIGQIVRAGVDDRQMVAALGINIGAVFTGAFAFGSAVAGFGGVLGGPVIGMFPDLGFELLISSLIVVVIGGLGTWKGAFAGALVVGMVVTLGQVWFPSLSLVIVFLLMALVLLLRPAGLLGRIVVA